MTDIDRKVIRLETKVELYEQHYGSLPEKLDNINSEVTHIKENISNVKESVSTFKEGISKLPCGAHTEAISTLKDSFGEIRKMTNKIFASIIATAIIMILVWGFKEISGVKIMKKLIAQEINKITYAAELYRN